MPNLHTKDDNGGGLLPSRCFTGLATLRSELPDEVVPLKQVDARVLPTRASAAAGWLAPTEEAQRVRREWDERPVAILPCGVRFAAARLPAALVWAAVRDSRQTAVDSYLAAALMGGPVICDRYAGWYYALMPALTVWDVPSTKLLGTGTTLGVPRPGIAAEDAARVYWSVPPGAPGQLCPPPAVSQLVMLGRYRAVEKQP